MSTAGCAAAYDASNRDSRNAAVSLIEGAGADADDDPLVLGPPLPSVSAGATGLAAAAGGSGGCGSCGAPRAAGAAPAAAPPPRRDAPGVGLVAPAEEEAEVAEGRGWPPPLPPPRAGRIMLENPATSQGPEVSSSSSTVSDTG
jgi:hypothetical protein